MKGYEQQCGNTCAQVAKLPWLSSQGAAQSGLSKCSATEAPYPEPPCGGAGNCKLGVGESWKNQTQAKRELSLYAGDEIQPSNDR